MRGKLGYSKEYWLFVLDAAPLFPLKGFLSGIKTPYGYAKQILFVHLNWLIVKS